MSFTKLFTGVFDKVMEQRAAKIREEAADDPEIKSLMATLEAGCKNMDKK